MFDQAWMKAEKKTDPKFQGSIWERLGFDDKICPVCDAHLKDGICLNACHLNATSRRNFYALGKKELNAS